MDRSSVQQYVAWTLIHLHALMQHPKSLVRRACHVKKTICINIVFEELTVTRLLDVWWHKVL